jgi:N-acetylglutamate synthase-like GNAT family acetyltransferase
MDQNQASQIATLLNEQNQLTVQYTAKRVLEHAPNYLVRIDDAGKVAACAELKKVQWYQFELLHVTVATTHLRKGLARNLIAEAQARAETSGARILQCTIRDGNKPSEDLFASSGFQSVCAFYNQQSKNLVRVWQKVLALPPAGSADNSRQ